MGNGNRPRVGMLGTDEQDELAPGRRTEQALDECGADETGAAGDGDAFPCELFRDHATANLPFGREVLEHG